MKVLISRPDKIGDVVLALHGAKQLKRLMPDVELYVHVSPYTRDLVENVKFIDGVVEFNEPLEDYNFDAVVDLMAKRETARVYTDLKDTIKIGNSARWFSYRYNRTRYIRRSRALLNEAEYNWQLISLLSPTLKNSILTDSIDASDFRNIQPYTEHTNFILLMPGVSVSAYSWPDEYWLELAQSLASAGNNVLILLGPAEQALKAKYEKLTDKNASIVIKSTSSFSQLLGILAACKHFVGPSTGITHLASAMGASGVALYPEERSMHPRRWLPFNTQLKCLSLSAGAMPADVQNTLLADRVPEKLDPIRRQKVSAFVVCCNEEKNIRRCLESIKWCDEIVVVDSGSRDKTLDIVKEYTDRVFFRPWNGHSEQKQFALEQCIHPWVLNIDSDEEVSMELKARLLRILSAPESADSKVKGFNICRVVYFLDRWWESGGWFPEYRLRFFQRELTNWGGVNPHEKAIVQGQIKKLKEPIYHFTYQNFAHQIDTLNKHSSLSAQCLYREGKRCRLHNIVLNPLFRFFKFYVLKSGFLEGRPGFIVAGLEACYTFFKYLKLWEIQRAESKEQLGKTLVSDDQQRLENSDKNRAA